MFAKAAGSWGVSSVTAALVFLCIGIYEHAGGHSLSSAVFVGAAFVLFALGGFVAWKTEYEALALEIARNVKPNIKADIDVARRDPYNGLCFLHVHLVNTGEESVTIRKVDLIDHTGNGRFAPVLFKKRLIAESEEVHITFSANEREISRTEFRLPVEAVDILDSLRTSPLVKGSARTGWLAFQIPYFKNECSCPSLSLQMEDSFGVEHNGQAAIMPFEYGATFSG